MEFYTEFCEKTRTDARMEKDKAVSDYNENGVEPKAEMPFHPAKGVLFAKVLEDDEELKELGFIRSGDTKVKPMRVKVVEAGEKADADDPDIKSGDIVLLPKRGNIRVNVNGEKYQLFRYCDIVGVM